MRDLGGVAWINQERLFIVAAIEGESVFKDILSYQRSGPIFTVVGSASHAPQNRCASFPTIVRPMLNEAVAAGEGALTT
jgi:hypothetical protein